ncbi:MAG TPA: ester cyclase [Conexibacter sp.]|nr:ester cyclase [Conexibacter sp.]
MGKEERNKRNVERLVKEVVIAGGDLDRAGEFIREDYVQHGTFIPQDFPQGLEGWKRTMRMVRDGFPDLYGENVVLVAEGDFMVNVAEVRATSADGRPIELIGIHVNRFDEDGKVAEVWSLYDNVAVLQQLGAVADVPAGIPWFGLPQANDGAADA